MSPAAGSSIRSRPESRLKGHVPRIVTELKHWKKPKITWRAVVSHIEEELGCRFSRQALEAVDDVHDAYAETKRRLRKGLLPARRKNAAERIAVLEAENRGLREQNDRLIEKFVRWATNAQIKGIREDQLEKPLPVARLSSDFRAERRKQKEAEKLRVQAKRDALRHAG